jgi:predicted nucleic acid-binding protein
MSVVGVLDAGVVLAVLDNRQPGHRAARALLVRGRQGALEIHLSVVNLAEVFQHALPITRASGLDLISLLKAYKVTVHRPDTLVARTVATLSSLPRASLADRFAAATALTLRARLHTTDRALAAALRKAGIELAVTLY